MKLSVINRLIDVLKNKVDDRHFEMGDWIINLRTGIGFGCYHGEHSIPECQTAGCIAGWVVLGVMTPEERVPYEGKHVVDIARRYMGIAIADWGTARELFNPSEVSLNKVERNDAIKVLEHLRDTGRIDWTITGLAPHARPIKALLEA